MKTIFAFFASTRYWTDEAELLGAFQSLSSLAQKYDAEPVLLCNDADLAALPQADCAVLFPMSGGVQSLLLRTAQNYPSAVVYASYVQGNADDSLTQRMLQYNAAPAVMDCWGVLKRTHPHVEFALNEIRLSSALRVFDAYLSMQGATLLLIGDTEPWVISNSSSLVRYERLGVTIRQVPQAEVLSRFEQMQDDAAAPFFHYFFDSAAALAEPCAEDVNTAARMAAALLATIEAHHAQGAAVACFNMLRSGTTSCLGVSYINDCTPYVAACEGDVDSAVTMLAMKKLSPTKLWMANPALHPDGLIHFSHCTAPLAMDGCRKCSYVLRSHHESGIGVSLQVDYPVESRVTLCRISNEAGSITIQGGTTVSGGRLCACHTQIWVHPDDFDHYLNTALGCHQVLAFADISAELHSLARQLKLTVLTDHSV